MSTVKVKVTNNAPGLQGIRHAGGVSYLRPGASRVLDFDEATGRRAERLSFLALEPVEQQDEQTTPPPPNAAAATALLAELDQDGLHFQTFKKRAGEILGPDDLPDTKDEIIAALKALG